MNKTIVDFTLLVQFRHPSEVGGLYWSVNMVLNQLFCFVSVYLYRKYSVEIDTINSASPSAAHSFYPAGANGTLDDIESGQATTPSTLPFWELVSGLFVLTVLCFCIFLRLINGDYLDQIIMAICRTRTDF